MYRNPRKVAHSQLSERQTRRYETYAGKAISRKNAKEKALITTKKGYKDVSYGTTILRHM
jgi:hypothetical protein